MLEWLPKSKHHKDYGNFIESFQIIVNLVQEATLVIVGASYSKAKQQSAQVEAKCPKMVLVKKSVSISRINYEIFTINIVNQTSTEDAYT